MHIVKCQTYDPGRFQLNFRIGVLTCCKVASWYVGYGALQCGNVGLIRRLFALDGTDGRLKTCYIGRIGRNIRRIGVDRRLKICYIGRVGGNVRRVGVDRRLKTCYICRVGTDGSFICCLLCLQGLYAGRIACDRCLKIRDVAGIDLNLVSIQLLTETCHH